MWTVIYESFSACMLLIFMLLVAEYVFLEPCGKYMRPFLAGSFLLILAGWIAVSGETGGSMAFPGGEELVTVLPVLLVGCYISMIRKKRKIRGFFLCIPVSGIGIGLLLPMLSLPVVMPTFSMKQSEIYFLAIDFTGYLFQLLFLWKGGTWRQRFHAKMQYRKLRKWESRLLTAVGISMYIIALPFTDETVLTDLPSDMKWYFGCIAIVAVLLTVTVIILVLRGNESDYYHAVADLNEQYLSAQVRHFQVYQKAQTETRRIRHDMKNHMLCLSHLAQEEDMEGIRSYLGKLTDMSAGISQGVQCGNSLVDAICSEKMELAKEYGIRFEISGRLTEQPGMEAVDLCTVFANALDNGIEALQQAEEADRILFVTVNRKDNILFLQFKNALKADSDKVLSGRTTKKDRINHGFGLENMKLAAKRYHGELHTCINTENGKPFFVLDIMMFCRS